MEELDILNNISNLNITYEKWQQLSKGMQTCLMNIAMKGILCREDYIMFLELYTEKGNFLILGENFNDYRDEFRFFTYMYMVKSKQIPSREFLSRIFGLTIKIK